MLEKIRDLELELFAGIIDVREGNGMVLENFGRTPAPAMSVIARRCNERYDY